MQSDSPSTQIIDTAAAWFVRQRSGLMTSAEQQQLMQWRAAHVDHENAYQEMVAVWGVAEQTPDVAFEEVLKQASANVRQAKKHAWRTVFIQSMVACGLVAALCVGYFTYITPFNRLGYTKYASTQNTPYEVMLSDGSTIVLNRNTVVYTKLTDEQRLVDLTQGEAYFDVAHNIGAPFSVQAGEVSVRVTGTQFTVYNAEDAVLVGVETGSVEVIAAHTAPSSYHLEKNQAIKIDVAQSVAERYPINPVQLTAWQRGQLVFDAVPLREAIAQVNRYRQAPIVLADARLASERIAGVFAIADTDTFLTAVADIIPVDIQRAPDGTVYLHATLGQHK